MFIFLLAASPHIFSPWSHKVAIATQIVADANNIWKHQDTEFHYIPVFVIFLCRPLLVLVYIGWSVFLLRHFLNQQKKIVVFVQQRFMTKWLIVLLVCLSVVILSHILMIIEANNLKSITLFYTLNTFQFLSGVGMIGLLVSPFLFPSILYGLPRMPKLSLPLMPSDEESKPLYIEHEKHETILEAAYLLEIQQKIESCIRKKQPYLNHNCNIAHISKMINIPSHHLAYYFREEKKRHFHDCCNDWRVNHAKKLIKDGKTSSLTIEAIGLSSGFSSKNTFFTAFKKREGITPGAFADLHHA